MAVLVIGAAGNIGRLVIGALLDLDAQVTAFVRATEREFPPGSVLAHPAVTVALGDLTEPETVRRAAKGCSAVFVLTPHCPDQVELQKAAVDAAAEADAAVVKLSSWTPSVYAQTPVPGSRRHWVTQQYILRCQVPCTILGPNYFMHNLVNRYAGDVRRRGVLPSPAGRRGISMVDARDVAEVAARALADDSHRGRTYTLTGPTAPTYAELAETLSRVTGREVSYHDMAEDEFAAWMESERREPWETAHAAAIFRLYREGAGELVTDDVLRVTGHPPRSIEAFLAQAREKFLPSSDPGG